MPNIILNLGECWKGKYFGEKLGESFLGSETD